jgi:hypothetical protein
MNGLELLNDMEKRLILAYRQMNDEQKADFMKKLKRLAEERRLAEESDQRKGANNE